MRKILFIDEFGDTGTLSPSSSDYFGICAIEIEPKNLPIVFQECNRFRYWNKFKKELKKLRSTEYEIFLEMIDQLIELDILKFTIGYFYKSNYKGPYYKGEHYDSKKLRNFSIRMTLEHHFSNNSAASEIPAETELIFDRYDISSGYKANLETYLKTNNNLPNFVDIVQVDSMVCEGLQISDFLSRSIKSKTKNFKEIDSNLKNSVFQIKGNF